MGRKGKVTWLITEEKLNEIRNNKRYRIVKLGNRYLIICSVCNHLIRYVTLNQNTRHNNKYLGVVNIYENKEVEVR